jgi:hypothetical protein
MLRAFFAPEKSDGFDRFRTRKLGYQRLAKPLSVGVNKSLCIFWYRTWLHSRLKTANSPKYVYKKEIKYLLLDQITPTIAEVDPAAVTEV